MAGEKRTAWVLRSKGPHPEWLAVWNGSFTATYRVEAALWFARRRDAVDAASLRAGDKFSPEEREL